MLIYMHSFSCSWVSLWVMNVSLEKKALPTTFLPAVKTLTKNISFVFLLVQVFFLQKKKCLVKVFAEQNLSLKKKA